MAELLTTAEVAGMLKVNAETIRRWHRAGKLRGIRIGKAIRFEQASVEVWLNGKRDDPPLPPGRPDAVDVGETVPGALTSRGAGATTADVSHAVREELGHYDTGPAVDSQSAAAALHVYAPSADDRRTLTAHVRAALSNLAMHWRDTADWQVAFDEWRQLLPPDVPDERAQRLFDICLVLWALGKAALEASALRALGRQRPLSLRERTALYGRCADAHLQTVMGEGWYVLPAASSGEEISSLIARFCHCDEDFLGALYAEANDADDRRSCGKYYTPPEIVSYILDSVGFPASTAKKSTLVDPACGSGAFVVAALRRLATGLIAAGMPKHTALEASCEAIVGVDNDPVAVVLARTNLVLQVLRVSDDRAVSPEENWSPRIYLADSVSPPDVLFATGDSATQLGDRELVNAIKLRSHPFEDGFHFVVANPPYGKVKDSRSLREFYKDSLYGHPNLYGLFLHLGVRILGSEGHLGFIIPKSLTAGLYFKNLRRLLLRRLVLKELVAFDERDTIFEGVLQENLILIGHNRSGRRAAPEIVLIREARNHVDLANGGSSVTIPLSRLDLGPRYDHVLCLSSRQDAYAVIEKVRERTVPLEDVGVRASTGKLVWNRRKPLLRHEPGDDSLPLLWGHNFSAFLFQPDRRFNSRPTHVACTARTEGERNVPEEMIVVKRITAKEQRRRIEAAYVPASYRAGTRGFFLENHLNFVSRRTPDCEYPMVYLMALLNSQLMDFLFRMLNGNTQVSATELNLLPVPLRPSLVAEVERLALTIPNLPEAGRESVCREIDAHVYAAYGMADREIACIEAASIACSTDR